ncbi:MAG: hypothetical protein Q9212_006576 [Teloschistes hypoglaucus]
MSSFSHPHNYYNNPPSVGWKVTLTDLISISFAFVFVLARLFTKFFLVKAPGWDDFAIIVALCFAISRLVVDEIALHHFGAGRHYWDIPPEYYNGFLTASLSHLFPIRATIAVDGYLYIVAIAAAKISLLLFLYRIFHIDKRFRIAAWITGAVLVLWSLITILLAIFSCKPIRASWDLKVRMDPKTVCYPKAYDVENIYGFCNVITDVVLIALPIPLVWKMQVSRKKKFAVAMVFATGAFVCAVAIVRQYIAYNSGKTKDLSRGIIPIKIWMALEVNVAIIVACLPALSPLFKRIPLLASLIPSSVRSKFSHASAMERAPWPQKLSGPNHMGGIDLERAGGREMGGSALPPLTSWQTPRAWREAERREFGTLDGESESESERSEETMQSSQRMYHVDRNYGVAQ